MVSATDIAGDAGGFITIHRQIRDWDLWRSMTGEQRMVVVTLLLIANWRPGSFWYGTKQIRVERGQFAHSEEEIARHAGVSRKVVRTTLAKLEADGFIVRENTDVAGPHPVVRTIKNYDKFQTLREKTGQSRGKSRANHGPMTGQSGALIEPEEPEEPEEQEKKASPADADERPPSEHQSIVRKLDGVYVEVRSLKYRWVPKDFPAVKRLHGQDVGEIERRWRHALGSSGFWSCDSVALFESRWNDYRETKSTATPPVTQRRGVPPPSTHFRGGKVEL